MLLLFLFILLDYLATLLLISYPNEESNVFARGFMEAFGVAWGLTIFSVLANLPLYLILGLLAFYPRYLRFSTSPFATSGLDLAFAWFVAGTHFSGAFSWLLNGASNLLYQLTGAALYLSILFVVGIRSRQQPTK
jgi:hypothetical protein